MTTLYNPRTRKQKRKTFPKRHPHCGLLPADLRKKGTEFQVYGCNTEGHMVYAGVHYGEEINARFLYTRHRQWLRWRAWYDNLPENRERDYPAKHIPAFGALVGHPVSDHTKRTVLWLKNPRATS